MTPEEQDQLIEQALKMLGLYVAPHYRIALETRLAHLERENQRLQDRLAELELSGKKFR